MYVIFYKGIYFKLAISIPSLLTGTCFFSVEQVRALEVRCRIIHGTIEKCYEIRSLTAFKMTCISGGAE